MIQIAGLVQHQFNTRSKNGQALATKQWIMTSQCDLGGTVLSYKAKAITQMPARLPCTFNIPWNGLNTFGFDIHVTRKQLHDVVIETMAIRNRQRHFSSIMGQSSDLA